MRKYIDSMLIGLGIASFCMLLNAIPYFGTKSVIFALLQGLGQGAIVPLIYSSSLNLQYFYKFLIHAAGSYFLMLVSVTSMGLKWNLLTVSVTWLIVFAFIFAYFYLRNHVTARKINEKLNRRMTERLRERNSRERK